MQMNNRSNFIFFDLTMSKPRLSQYFKISLSLVSVATRKEILYKVVMKA
jgi:hypothetical protein